MARLIVEFAIGTLLFKAGGWWLRWRGLRHQMLAAQNAISDQAYLAQVLAGYRAQIRAIVRLPRLHLPHFHVRRSA